MQKDNRFSYELYKWSNFGKVEVHQSTLKDAGDGVFAQCDFSPHDMISFFDGAIIPYDPLFGYTPKKSYDLNIGNIDGGIYICRGHKYDEVKAFTCNRMMAKNKKSVVSNDKPKKSNQNIRHGRKRNVKESARIGLLEEKTYDEEKVNTRDSIDGSEEEKAGENIEKNVERLINVAQMCNDSLDNRINAEVMCFDTSMVPPEWAGLSTNCAQYNIDGEVEVRFTSLPITIIIYAVKPIKKGQEIYISYGSNYWEQ